MQPTVPSISANVSTSMRISDVVKVWAERLPDNNAVIDPSGSWTYRALQIVISQTADWLRSSGVRAGDRVMIVGENCREFAAVLLAISSLDAWPVPVNAHLSAREIDAVRDHAKPVESCTPRVCPCMPPNMRIGMERSYRTCPA